MEIYNWEGPLLTNLPYSIISYSNKISSFQKCGFIHPDLFVVNLPFYTESIKYNTCLNRKVSIDSNGNIKHCPAMNKSAGNINDDSIKKLIENEGFKEIWYIVKDRIDICKDCEFRYICTDCRCFIKDPDNICSQPAKCTYNPYIAKWDGEEGYVPVENCGSYTKETGFIPDAEKIASLSSV